MVGDLHVHFITIGILSLLTLVISATARNRIKLGRLLEKLQNEPFIANTNRGGDEEQKLIDSWTFFSNTQATALAIFVVLSIVSQIIYTVGTRIRSSDYHDWSKGFGEITIINTTYSPNYEITMIYQDVSIACLVINGCCSTLLISGLQALIGTQFKLLQNCLRRIENNSRHKMLQESTSKSLKDEDSQDLSDIPWKYVQRCLKDAVTYHLDILNVVTEMEDIFRDVLLTLYIGTLVILCIEVYRISWLPAFDIRTLSILIEAMAGSFHSAIICFSGERMAHESQEVARAVYDINFFGSDLRFQKSLILLIRASQTPVRIKAGKMIDTSVVTFVWILRASYSMCMVLRSTNTPEN